MRRLVCTLLILLGVTPSLYAKIDVPDKVDRDTLVLATVEPSAIPPVAEGERVQTTVLVTVSEGADIWTPPNSATTAIVAPPGTYKITANIVWVKIKTVTIGDQTFDTFLGLGQYQETAQFTVEGEQGPDPPNPVPTPPGEKWMVIIEESSKRTPEEANLYIKIRQSGVPRVLIADQHDDSERIRQYVDLIPDGAYLPRAVVVDKDGKLVTQVPLPGTIEGIRALLK